MLRAVHQIAIIWLLIFGGCGSSANARNPAATASAAAPAVSVLRAGPPLVTPGEQIQYQLSLRGVDLATYELAVGELDDIAGRRAVAVQSHAKTTGIVGFFAKIDDRFTSWIDVATGRPLRFQTDEFASGSQTDVEHAIIDFAGRADNTIQVSFRLNDAEVGVEQQRVTEPVVWDFNAFMVALRSWEATPGAVLSLEVFRSRYLWRVEITHAGIETHPTALGDLPAVRFEGKTYRLDRSGTRDASSAERDLTIWISNDDGRVPLEIKATTDYGALRMKITDYQPGSGARLR